MKGDEQNPIQVMYFLSWMNRVEHPHLIQVDHHSPRDLRLRNVKRWLSVYRGKEFPESFAWSCKRRYKMDYVWQDLMDDDVITPFSDHEYVLQGSLISTTPWDYLSFGEATIQDRESDSSSKLFELKKDTSRLLASQASVTPNFIQTQCKKQYQIRNNPLKNLHEAIPKMKNANVDLPHATSTQSRSATRSEMEEAIDGVKNRTSNSSGDSLRIMNNEIVGMDEWLMSSPSPIYSPPKKSASSNMLLNLLTCGVVETNDSAVKLVNRPSSTPSDIVQRRRQRQPHDNGHWGIYCYDDAQNMVESSELSTDKMRSATATPLREPNCSQCGKCFKPEKLHMHMKSCRGIKHQGKVNTTAASIVERMSLQNQ